MSSHKQTKIVATIGPATEDETVLNQLIAAGMNVARFNTKHADPDWHAQRLERVKQVASKVNQSVATLLDLQGPEIRVVTPQEASFEVKQGKTIVFTSEPMTDQKQYVLVPQLVIDALSEGDEILLDDGACELTVVEKSGTQLTLQALTNSIIKHRKTLNTPGIVLDVPSLTERDYNYLDGVDPQFVDFVGLSFVRNAEDITILRNELKKRKFKAHIVAKIENQSALDNLDEIIAASEAVMVARGDLGVEVAYQELGYWQKTIIEKCRRAAKPVITATHMLKSMVDSPRPTRAEVSDVTNAIFDGTDAVMLSEETTIGKYPIKAVTVQATIAEFNEKKTANPLLVPEFASVTSAVTHAAANLVINSALDINHIVCLTESGNTVKQLARFRPSAPIIGVTYQESTLNQLALVYGVRPYHVPKEVMKKEKVEQLLSQLKKDQLVKVGDTILAVYGRQWGEPGHTNSLSIIKVE